MKELLLSLNKYFAIVPGQLRPYRKIVLILALLSTFFMGYGATRFVLDTSFESWFSEEDPAVKSLNEFREQFGSCLLYTSPSPRDQRGSRMPSSA